MSSTVDIISTRIQGRTEDKPYKKFGEISSDFFYYLFRLLLEVERNLLVGQLLVDISVGCNPGLNIGLVLGIKVNLEDTLSIDLASGPLSSDFSGVDNIVKDGLLDGSQSSRTRSDTLGLVRPGEGLS